MRKEFLRVTRIAALSAALPLMAVATTVAMSAPHASAYDVPQPAIVSATPAVSTPDVLDEPGYVHSIAQTGGTMVAGGSFTQVRNHGSATVLTRNNLFSFDAATGQVTSGFAPNVDGLVRTVAVDSGGTEVFAGGEFHNVNGVANVSLAKIRLSDGSIDTSFVVPGLDGRLFAMRLDRGWLYIGGTFTKVGGLSINGLARLNPTTGAVDPNFKLGFAGQINGGITMVENFDISPDGTRLAVIGNFDQVLGATRPQIAMLDLTGPRVSLADWETNQYSKKCNKAYNAYLRDVEFSPDGSYFVLASTGGGPCDTASRWETGATGTALSPTWIDSTGGDTLLSAAVTGTAVYVGGHNRWVNNVYGLNKPQSGSFYVSGLAALDPRTGVPFDWTPTRTTGVGVFDLLATSDGLWVGHDTDYIGHAYHYKLAYFPLAGGTQVPTPSAGSLPSSLYQLGNGSSNASTSRVLYRVNAGGPLVPATDTGPDWQADTDAAPSPYHNAGNVAETWSTTLAGVAPEVPSSTPHAIFADDRKDSKGAPEMAWTFPLAAGTPIEVRLYFANMGGTGSQSDGKRDFETSIDGRTMTWGIRTTLYDIVKDVGPHVATMKPYDETVGANGQVTISFTHHSNDPIISGIEILRTCGSATATTGKDTVVSHTFDGSTAGTDTPVSTSGTAWGQARGAFMLSGQLYTGWADGHLCRQSFDGTTLGAMQPINMGWTGYTNKFADELPSVNAMFFSKDRIYYTEAGSDRLSYRYLAPEDNMVSDKNYDAQGSGGGIDFSAVNGMVLIGSKLYFTQADDGVLRRIDWDGTETVDGTATAISGPGIDGVNWRQQGLAVYVPSSAVAPNEPPRARVAANCTTTSCAFTSSGSGDADGTITSYAWDFGDGATSTARTPSHTYASLGNYTVTLTVTDDDGATGTKAYALHLVAANISFVGSDRSDATGTSFTVQIPAGVSSPDGLVLIATADSTSATINDPAGGSGWTLVKKLSTGKSTTAVWQTVAQAGDAGQNVTVTMPTSGEVNLVLLAYRGTDPIQPVGSFAAVKESTSQTTHTTPTTTVSTDGSWALSLWTERSASSVLSPPATQTQRTELCGAASPNRVCMLTSDNAAPLPAGTSVGGLMATADTASINDTMWTLVLAR